MPSRSELPQTFEIKEHVSVHDALKDFMQRQDTILSDTMLSGADRESAMNTLAADIERFMRDHYVIGAEVIAYEGINMDELGEDGEYSVIEGPFAAHYQGVALGRVVYDDGCDPEMRIWHRLSLIPFMDGTGPHKHDAVMLALTNDRFDIMQQRALVPASPATMNDLEQIITDMKDEGFLTDPQHIVDFSDTINKDYRIPGGTEWLLDYLNQSAPYIEHDICISFRAVQAHMGADTKNAVNTAYLEKDDEDINMTVMCMGFDTMSVYQFNPVTDAYDVVKDARQIAMVALYDDHDGDRATICHIPLSSITSYIELAGTRPAGKHDN